MNATESAWEKWTRLIAEQRGSGETVAAFCARHGIPESSFYPWKRKPGERTDVAGTPCGAPAFVEAKVRSDDDGRAAGVTIELRGGRRVAVARGFDPRLLLEVIQTLESLGEHTCECTGAAS